MVQNDFVWCKKLIYKYAARSNDRNNFIENLPGKKLNYQFLETFLDNFCMHVQKNVHSMLNDEIYIENGGVAIYFPLAPLLTNIFIALLEEEVTPTLTSYLCNGKEYVDDTHSYVNPEKIRIYFHKTELVPS